MSSDKFIGKRIGIFKILNKIDDGTYSTVYLAEEDIPLSNRSKDKKTEIKENKNIKSNFKRKLPLLRRYVACKIISREKIEKRNLLERLGQEIRVSKLMHHPNVLQFIDFQKDDSYFYIFQEYVPCGELFHMIQKYGKFSEEKAAILFKQILLGVQYIHSLCIAHCNLKPQNILVDQFGRIKIGNFGVSKVFLKDTWLTKIPHGSSYYLSPESIGCYPYDAKKSDIWSCGVILYSITTGHLPWTKKSQSELFEQIKVGKYAVPTNVSESCSDLIKKLMEIDVSKRISIEEALNHPFLKENDYNEIKLGSKKSNDLQFSGYEKVLNCLSEIQANKDSSLIKIRKEFQNESDKVIPTV